MKKRDDFEDIIAHRAAKNHPLKNMIYFVIAGITMLFVTLMVLFGFNNPQHFFAGHHFPKPFLLSTIIIFVSSYFIEKSRRAFNRENGKQLLDNLLITMVLAVGFTIAQASGWKELWDGNITLYGVGGIPNETKTPSGAFLFIISGLHLLHLVGGLIFLFATMFKVVNVRSDDVRSVIYFADRLEKTRMEMLATYWHFLGGLWFLLFIYFLWFFV